MSEENTECRTTEKEVEVSKEEEEKSLQLCVLNANQALRRKWLQQGVIQDVKERVWIAAG